MLIIVSGARLLLPLLPTLSQTSRFIGCGNSETAFRRLRIFLRPIDHHGQARLPYFESSVAVAYSTRTRSVRKEYRVARSIHVYGTGTGSRRALLCGAAILVQKRNIYDINWKRKRSNRINRRRHPAIYPLLVDCACCGETLKGKAFVPGAQRPLDTVGYKSQHKGLMRHGCVSPIILTPGFWEKKCKPHYRYHSA